jgi:hypothetical protein
MGSGISNGGILEMQTLAARISGRSLIGFPAADKTFLIG